jgi:hypothetical protein
MNNIDPAVQELNYPEQVRAGRHGELVTRRELWREKILRNTADQQTRSRF